MTGAPVEKAAPRRCSPAGRYQSAISQIKQMRILKLNKENYFQTFMVVAIPPGKIN